MGKGCLEGVVGTEDVNIDDGFHGVGAELLDRGEEVACCSGAVERLILARNIERLGGFNIHDKIQSPQLFDTSLYSILHALHTSNIYSTNAKDFGA